MLRGLFVTGTDTNVGKTVVAAALMLRYRGVTPLRYWKPIQTGIEQDDDTATVRNLGSCREPELLTAGVRLARPVSPHLAARLSQTEIRISDLQAIIEREASRGAWIVEGAGGVLVPINESEKVIDLISCLALPALVVSRSALGTINHTLLTIEALRSRAVQVAGVVVVGDKTPGTTEAIEHYGGVKVLGEMPRWSPLTPETLCNWARAGLDTTNTLSRYFRYE